MDTFYKGMLERLETLARKDFQIDQDAKKLERDKTSVGREFEDNKTYLQNNGFGDPAVKAEFQRIIQLKKELAANGKASRAAAGPNKTHVIIQILQEHGQDGLEIGEIMEHLAARDLHMDRNYVNTILGKLRKLRGMVIKEGKKFFLTEPGKNAKTAANAAG